MTDMPYTYPACMLCLEQVMRNTAGGLLGDEDTAPAAAAGSSGGMFAGLDVGTSASSQQPSQSAIPSTSAVPQSPLDALAGLQGPSPSHTGTVPGPVAPPKIQTLLSCVPYCSTPYCRFLHHGEPDRHLTACL